MRHRITHIQSLNCVLRDDADLMFYNGLAFVSDNLRRLRILKSIIESDFLGGVYLCEWETIRIRVLLIEWCGY